MIAVGVASPSAQGQAMTSTATAARMPVIHWLSLHTCAGPVKRPHARKVAIAMTMTTGTNTAAT